MRIKKCSECGTENLANATYCNECGSPLDNTINICPKCGEENRDKAKFCMSCGARLTEDDIQKSEYSSDHENNQGETAHFSENESDPITLHINDTYVESKIENISPEPHEGPENGIKSLEPHETPEKRNKSPETHEAPENRIKS